MKEVHIAGVYIRIQTKTMVASYKLFIQIMFVFVTMFMNNERESPVTFPLAVVSRTWRKRSM